MTAPIVYIYDPRTPVPDSEMPREVELYADGDYPWALRYGSLWSRLAESGRAV